MAKRADTILEDIRASSIEAAEKKEGLTGARLEAFKSALDMWIRRGEGHAKRLVAGRKAGEISAEEQREIFEELKRLSKADIERAGDMAEGAFDKLARERRDNIWRCYEETGSWHKVYTTEVYADDSACAEAFIDLVEEKAGGKVESAEDLIRLIGMNTEETDILEGFTDTIRQARLSRYGRALEECLNNGGKYPDLLKIAPESFGLEKEDQKERIRAVIGWWAHVMGAGFMRPDVGEVAERLEAPYSEIFHAANPGFHHLTDKWKAK